MKEQILNHYSIVIVVRSTVLEWALLLKQEWCSSNTVCIKSHSSIDSFGYCVQKVTFIGPCRGGPIDRFHCITIAYTVSVNQMDYIGQGKMWN